jgi:SOS-response transcriptional repressor LexA
MARLDVQAAVLREGRVARFRPTGNSMRGKIDSGQLVTCEPVTDGTPLDEGDIVLCKVGGRYVLHCIYKIIGNQYEIRGYNSSHSNGRIGRQHIFGKCVSVEA